MGALSDSLTDLQCAVFRLHNFGNTCYANALLQSMFHAGKEFCDATRTYLQQLVAEEQTKGLVVNSLPITRYALDCKCDGTMDALEPSCASRSTAAPTTTPTRPGAWRNSWRRSASTPPRASPQKAASRGTNNT